MILTSRSGTSASLAALALSLGMLWVVPAFAQDSAPAEEPPAVEQATTRTATPIPDREYGTARAEGEPATMPGPAPINFWSKFGLVIIFLVALCGLAVGVLNYARKGMLPIKALQSEGGLRIAESRMLGNKQFLMVVEYDNQKMLLGISPDRIQHLCFLETDFEDERERAMSASEDIGQA